MKNIKNIYYYKERNRTNNIADCKLCVLEGFSQKYCPFCSLGFYYRKPSMKDMIAFYEKSKK
jgi:hypothetical protein